MRSREVLAEAPPLIEERQAAYDRLFDDSAVLSQEQMDVPAETLAMTALTRRMSPKVGSRASWRENIQTHVFNVLGRHQYNAGLEDEDNALFDILTKADFERVNAITATVVCRWQAACIQAKLPSPFHDRPTPDSPDAKKFTTKETLVIEAAAGVLATLQAYPSKVKDTTWAEALVTRCGPGYALRWLNGSRAAELFPDGTQAQQDFLPQLTPSHLRRLITRGGDDPEGALLQRAQIFMDDLSEVNLAEKLDWHPVQVKNFFSPSLRALLAMRYPETAVDHAIRMKTVFDEELSDKNILKELGISLGQLLEFVPYSLKRYAATNSYTNPMDTIRKSVALAGELVDQYGLPPALCAQLAMLTPKSARAQAGRIRREMATVSRQSDSATTAWQTYHDTRSAVAGSKTTHLPRLIEQKLPLDLAAFVPEAFRPFAADADKVMWTAVTSERKLKVAYLEACGATWGVRNTNFIEDFTGSTIEVTPQEKFALLLMTLGADLPDIEAYSMGESKLRDLLWKLGLSVPVTGRVNHGQLNRATYLACRSFLEPITETAWEFTPPELEGLESYIRGGLTPVGEVRLRDAYRDVGQLFAHSHLRPWQSLNLLMLLNHAAEPLPNYTIPAASLLLHGVSRVRQKAQA